MSEPMFVPVSNELIPLLEDLLAAAKRGDISSVAALVSQGADSVVIVTSQPVARAFLRIGMVEALKGLLEHYASVPGMMFDEDDK